MPERMGLLARIFVSYRFDEPGKLFRRRRLSFESEPFAFPKKSLRLVKWLGFPWSKISQNDKVRHLYRKAVS